MIVRDLYDLHFARSWEAFVQLRDAIVRRWFTDSALVGFTKYMCGQWLYWRFSCWLAFATPCGYATTNNPAETFNASLKRDYTLRRRLKMGALLRELSSSCPSTSESPKTFMTTPVPASTLTRRAQDMKCASLLSMSEGQDLGFTCAGAPQVIRVLSMCPLHITVAPNKRTEEGIAVSAQMGSSYARKEVEGQPWGGWPVDVQQQ
ncbi:hypothetical protein P3T76_005633 [Phytophthora citrophthora]|uniref:Uncharacterized protein n=1 Tax=Phytophthora citrophthora TaxID=4793 RepID=A0AAD9LNZ4_9STRA|nr:hypothetical protein P3T76_005633 [Phytophthora citrophthora]